ncbi:MAG: hypothetical protein L0177_12505 [Chloroflexi bacterium]|nr:hypothetical protein [Chloroflexota bacterium]
METSIDEAKLKKLLKEALAEALDEQRDLLHEILTEIIEDISLSRAIEEGENTEPVSREEIFNLLENQP